ncbi:MAG: phage virion morphogenesis protein [Rhodospirillales bacterium CG15_BIG_FIL_POST_REV_8_21_14_020_66_15]|nr:MAG: phage virion morphogenesis protein [Rhodospirillales bacterium CG15_BIG_FIL_POST_REV_8_21_14_020_66_15]
MAGAAIEIRANIRGTEAIQRRLAKMLSGVSNLEPLMDEIGGIMVASTQHNFETGRAPDGTAWIPSQRALAEGGQTLIHHGILLSSITHQANKDSVEWGSGTVYAGIHQLGGRAGRRGATKLPARPYLGISAGDERAIEAAIADYLGGLVQ